MSTIKFYKDSNGAFRLTDCTGKLAYINKGDIVSAYAENGVCSMIFSDEVYNRFTNIHNKNTAITDFVNASSVAYNEAGLNAVLSDFFVKSAGISSGVEVINALGYTPEDAAKKGAASGYAGLDLDQKIDKSNLNAVDDLGGTIYHSMPWFTPVDGQSVTISADGLTVTLSSGALFTNAMVGARIVVNGIRRVVGSYTSTSVMGVSYAFPASMRGVTYTYDKWSIHSRSYVMLQYNSGNPEYMSEYTITGNRIRYVDINNSMIISSPFFITNVIEPTGINININSGKLNFSSGCKINFSNSTYGAESATKDVGLKRNSSGILEINDGNTAGVYRDLNLRNLNYTGALTNTSDIRLKQKIRPVTDGLKKVIDISKTIRHYEFIDQDAYGSGVITSEIAQYLLELGFDGHVKQRAPRNESEGKLFGWEYEQREIVDQEGNPVLDQEGNKTFETVVTKEGDLIYTVDSQALTIYLFPAIVELNDKITAIEERLNKAGL
jgi:hypothetical protein